MLKAMCLIAQFIVALVNEPNALRSLGSSFRNRGLGRVREDQYLDTDV
jgi:hypothetical protein